MSKSIKRLLIVVVAGILIRTLYPLMLNMYFSPDKENPTIYDVKWSKQTEFILITCEIYSVDQVKGAKVHYNNEIVEMDYTSSVSGQADRVRYKVYIPLIDDNVEVNIVAYDMEGDYATYIVER